MTAFRFLTACILLLAWSCAMAIEEPRYVVVRA
jgi:hypothetical protein